MSFFVYILRCSDNSFYVGHTDDLDKRIAEHKSGAFENSYTETRMPLTLVYAQELPTRDEALQREMQLKGWSRKKKEALIAGEWNELVRLARGKAHR